MNATRLLAHFDSIAEAPDAIPRLRRFILELAVRGKLVPQDPNDEPAAELLKRIQQEKARLIDEGEAKEQKQTWVIGLGEEPFVIPGTWQWVRLGEIAFGFRYGTSVKCSYEPTGEAVLRIPNVENRQINIEDLKFGRLPSHEAAKLRLRLGDILMVRSNGSLNLVGRPALVEAHAVGFCYAGYLVRVRTSEIHLEGFYLVMALGTAHIREQIEIPIRTTVGLKNVNATELSALTLPLPPLGEQHRIVAKVDELMALCARLEAAQAERERRRDRLVRASLDRLNRPVDGGDARVFRDHARFTLDQLPRLVTRAEHIQQLRQTILNLAVRGKLVSQDPKDEPASELLKRIQKEKALLAKDGGLKKDKTPWDGLPKKPPHELPLKWVWTRLQDVFEVSRGGSPRPAGDPRYFGGPIPWITVREITKDSDKYLTKTESGLTQEGTTRSRFINPGDLLLTNSGATLGVPKISRIRACMNDGVAVLRLFHSISLNDFTYLYLLSQTDVFRAVNQGMGQPNLNTAIIAGWFYPLPPVAEQRRIVAKLDELLGVV